MGILKREDMSLGQMFQYCREFPDEYDGFIFEQKINKTISEEFIRLQAKVEGGFDLIKDYEGRLMKWEERLEQLRL